ncbi:MAG: UDP-3-O-(3-hydroxymyristoyl)glucosamine N-acyltransferase [Puniceicoccales bacterium]|jgi:UDP-3-O-[3-hydroxymyristoyl] glucosamine N-acyltransferase|nr:UDP-3-O-(3-hydroxymyristoyl)glucosamine N-acyltransferase [Puniceicoccales bacterium]
MEYSMERLLELLHPTAVLGHFAGTIRGVASLELAREGDLAFLDSRRYAARVAESRASILLLPESFAEKPRPGVAHFLLPNPSQAMNLFCMELERGQSRPMAAGIHPTAIVDADATVHPSATVGPYCTIDGETRIGANAVVQSHCTIGPRCHIGESARLHPRVCLYQDVEVGARCVIHSGAVIGKDGYGYASEGDRLYKLAHVGRVVLEEDVEVGANCTIDRARFSETRIGSGTKMDNLVHIGHNVTLGKNCAIVAQVGIAGSTRLGDSVALGGQVGIAGHISIGAGSMVAAQAGVTGNLPPGSIVRGTPAMPLALANRYFVLRKRVPELFRRVEFLEKNLPRPDTPPAADREDPDPYDPVGDGLDR